MKKIILAIAATLFMGELTATAQTRTTVSINGMKGSDLESIDSTKYRITYEGKWVNNPSIKPYIYTESEMRLDIGNKVTYFYDRTKQLKDSLMRVRAKTGNFDFSDLPKGGRFPFSYYKNYPATGQSTHIESVGMLVGQNKIQGQNLVRMVCRRHSDARGSLETLRTARSDTEGIR